MKKSIKLYSCDPPSLFILLITLTSNAFANGVGYTPAVTGSNPVLADSLIKEKFIVDEYVELNIPRKKVRVTYFVTNKTGNPIPLSLAYPLFLSIGGQDNNCTNGNERPSDYIVKLASELKPEANINGHKVDTNYAFNSSFEFGENYRALKEKYCGYITIPAILNPGLNTINITHVMMFGFIHADGSGDSGYHEYPIWPAKNWISKFGVAKFRVVQRDNKETKPIESGTQADRRYRYGIIGGLAKYGNRDGKYYKVEERNGPGKRIEYEDGVEFIVSNAEPKDSITISISNMTPTLNGKANVAEYLDHEEYVGDHKCYGPNKTFFYQGLRGDETPNTEAINIYRNEIFARKGYIFKSDGLRRLFLETTWYVPRDTDVNLNKVEAWNVLYLKEADAITKNNKNIYYEDIHTKIIKKLRKKIPEICNTMTYRDSGWYE